MAHWPDLFERDTGGTEAEWLRWLPEACGTYPLELGPPGQAQVRLGGGRLKLAWAALPPRRIALICLPRLQVRYQFEDVPDALREPFMRYFDLAMQRGGG